MDKISTRKILIAFVIFILITVVFLTSVIFSTKFYSATDGNLPANIMNGGIISVNNDTLYYSLPDKPGIFRTGTKQGSKTELISADGKGNVQYSNNKIYFSEGNKFIECNTDGSGKITVLDFAKHPVVKNINFYYIDSNGELCKKRGINGKVIDLNIKPKTFLVYLLNIYYIGEDKKLYRCGIDGKNSEMIISREISEFMIDLTHIYFMSDGTVYSAATNDLGNQIKQAVTDSFAVMGGYMAYNKNEGLYSKDMDSGKEVKLTGEKAAGLGTDSNSFYYINSAGKLTGISPDGKTKINY